MPTVTINIAGADTQLSNGGTSNAGHMWYTLTNSNGSTLSYGYGPATGNIGVERLFGPGEKYVDDNATYISTPANPIDQRTIDISQAQYDAMKNFGDNPTAGGFNKDRYNALNNSCVDFVWKGLDRWSDKHLLGESVEYLRGGGDGFMFGFQPSGNLCPQPRVDIVQLVLLKGK